MTRLTIVLGTNSETTIRVPKHPLSEAISSNLSNPPRAELSRAGMVSSVILASSLVTVSTAEAAVFEVTNNSDAGAGSLRQAIIDSNNNAGPDAIVFDSAVTGNITLTSGELPIYDDLAIVGPGSANLSIDGNGNSRIFRTNDGSTYKSSVEISGLTITNGNASGGGAIYNYGENLTIRDSVISNSDGGLGGAGAIESNDGVLQIIDSTIQDNTSNESGGAIAMSEGVLLVQGSTITGNTTDGGYGGAIYADDLVGMTIDNTTISNNYSSGSGGGIATNSMGGPVLISNSSITGNTAAGSYGGGIHSDGFNYYGGALTIDNTDITSNVATNRGGGVHSGEGSLFIKNNSLISDNNSYEGAGVFFAENNVGNILDINNSTISNNTATEGYGGGIHFYSGEADLRIQNSTISGNYANGGGGGIAIYYSSGGATHIGSIKLQNTTISNNTAGNEGGGLMLEVDEVYTPILIEDSVITGNSASDDGGGLHFYFDDGLYTGAVIRNTTISNNTAQEGGGLWWYDDDGYNLVIEHSTFSGNYAYEGDGGGLWLYSDDGAPIISNTTFSNNDAYGDGGGLFLTHEDGDARIENSTIVDNYAYGYGGGLFNDSDQVTLRSTIVANNDAYNGYQDIGGQDIYAQFSLIENPDGFSLSQDFNNLFYMDPMLGPLANNGGSTLTHDLLAGSPAIDSGINAGHSADDQTGSPRMVGLQTDMGAVESATDTALSFPAATQTVTNLNDSGAGSLRQAVIDANNNAGLDVIEFQGGLSGTITLTSGEISIDDDLVINAPVPSVITVEGGLMAPPRAPQGGGNYRIFRVYSGRIADRGPGGGNLTDVTINGLTITNGLAQRGGAIYAQGVELTVRNSTLTSNTAGYDGGAVYHYGGVTRIIDSTLSNNIASYSGEGGGGAVAINGAGNYLLGALVVRGSTFDSNEAQDGSGGAIFTNDGAGVAIDNSTISGNTADNDGGGVGIYDLQGSITISDSMITGNTAYSDGGGISVYDLSNYNFALVTDNSTISGNSASNYGGGIHFDADAHRLNVLNNSIISNNYAYDGGGIAFTAAEDGAHLTIDNSSITGNTAYYDGGGLHFYSPNAQLDILSSTISNNSAGGEGGGIHVYYSDRTTPVNIIGSTFDSNTASGEDGGAMLISGDDFDASILIENTIVTNNYAADDGGGLSTYADDGFYTGRFTIRDSVFDNNEASDNGGGIYIFDEDGDANFIIENSTISNNTAGDDGGGIWFYSDDGGFVISNSTLSGNTAATYGGGLFVEYSEEPRHVLNSTVTQNTADYGGGIYTDSPLYVRSSIIDNNTATNTGQDVGGDDTVYLQFSLLEDDTDISSLSINDDGTNVTGQTAMLGALANNGGATQTHLPMAGSPAINRGLNFGQSVNDQRGSGFNRTQGTRTDMGATEVAGNPVLGGNLTGSPIPENAGVGTIDATLTESAGIPTVVDLTFGGTAVLNTDFTVDTNFLFIPTGDLMSQAPVTITGTDDNITEGDEPFDAMGTTLRGPAFPTQNGIIQDDEGLPSFSISLVGDPIAENGGVATVTGTLSNPSVLDVTANLLFSGTAGPTDFTAPTMLTVPAGMTTADIQITAIDDPNDEPDETVVVDVDTVMNGVENGVQQVMTTITDDDAPPLVSVTLSLTTVTEGLTTDVILTLSEASGQDVTIDLGFTGTADMPADYTVSATSVTIPAGMTTGSVTITAVMDPIVDPNETVIIDIINVTNGVEDGVQQGTVTILDGAPVIVPTLSTVGKWVMAILIPIAAFFGLRRRRDDETRA